MEEIASFQEEALDFMWDRDRFIYADPMGARKTATTLLWLRGHFPEVRRILIVAPLSVLGHWQREAEKWFPDLEVIRGDGTPAKREKARQAVLEGGRWDGENGSPAALLLHYEGVRQDIDELVDLRWDAVIFDEAHRLKGRTTLVSKASVLLARRTRLLALLTGTPLVNRADEVWSLLRLCDPDTYRSYWKWTRHYFHTEIAHWIKSPQPVELVKGLKPGALEPLREEVKPWVLQRPIEKIMPELPEVEHIMYPVALTPGERRIYDGLEKHSWVQAEDGSILQVSNQVAKMTRQRQLASDFSSLFGGGAPGSKAKATVELVKDLLASGEQVVVMAAYRQTVDSIVEALGGPAKGAVNFHGALDSNERQERIDRFVSGHFKVLVGTLATLAEGVDGLQKVSRDLVMVDRDWTPARNDQAAGRLRRSGQGNTVRVHHVYAENTIDETVALTCESKERIIEEVLA